MGSRCCLCVCVCLYIPRIIARQWLGKSPPIVARQYHGNEYTRNNIRIVGHVVFSVARVVSRKVSD
jgi:hypothetical protein